MQAKISQKEAQIIEHWFFLEETDKGIEGEQKSITMS